MLSFSVDTDDGATGLAFKLVDLHLGKLSVALPVILAGEGALPVLPHGLHAMVLSGSDLMDPAVQLSVITVPAPVAVSIPGTS